MNYIDLNEPQTAVEKLKLLADAGRPVTLDAKAVLELHERVSYIESLLKTPPPSIRRPDVRY